EHPPLAKTHLPANARSNTRYDVFFFFHDTPTTEIYTLSLHDALPISSVAFGSCERAHSCTRCVVTPQSMIVIGSVTTSGAMPTADRKSTRLNSSHVEISYAVFCLKKKNATSGIADYLIELGVSHLSAS